jgi:hypothetical protein
VFLVCQQHLDRASALLQETNPVAITERDHKNLADALKYPFIVSCDVDKCFYVVSAATYAEAEEKLNDHSCPFTGGPTKIGLLVSRTILENAWIKLDALLTTLLDDNLEPEDKISLRNQCRGMAEILALFMSPHFTTGDEVSREAKRRYDSRKAGEDPGTPGLGPVKLAPARGVAQPTQLPVTAAKPVHKLNDTEVAAIKHAASSGFDPADLAKVYKVSVEVIKQVIA